MISLNNKAAAQELLDRRAARTSLISFSKYTMPQFEVSDHHEIIAAALERTTMGEGGTRLMIFAPPRHTKSELSSRRFPAWYIGNHPGKQIMSVTYNSDLAADFGREVRGIVDSESYGVLFDTRLRADSKSANRWHTNKNGVYISTGIGGGITGRGADIALIDDPLKGREQADSQRERDRVWRWYTSELYTRLMPNASIIIILTRWHEDDLAGRLLAEQDKGGDQWEVISLEAISDEGSENERALWPAWYGLDYLKRTRNVIGPREWGALYQQNPVPDEGTYFCQKNFNFFKKLPENLNFYGSSDYAVTEGGGDFTEHGIFGIDENDDIYVVDWWSGQTQSDEWIEAQLDLAQKYRPLKWVGETGPIKRAVEPFLMLRMRQRRCYVTLDWQSHAANGKEVNARTFQALVNAGKVFLPENAQWARELLMQLVSFPGGKYDDKVDVCSLFARMIHETWAASPCQQVVELSKDRWDMAFNDQDSEADSWKLA